MEDRIIICTVKDARARLNTIVEACNYVDFSQNVVIGKLIGFDTKPPIVCPFVIEGYGAYDFIRKTDGDKYKLGQSCYWSAKVGCIVQVHRAWDRGENGFYHPMGDVVVGDKYKVVRVDNNAIVASPISTRSCNVLNYYCLPYFAISEVTEKYRKYTNEEMKRLYGETLYDEKEFPHMITDISQHKEDVCVVLNGDMLNATRLLDSQYHLGGGYKCGVKL